MLENYARDGCVPIPMRSVVHLLRSETDEQGPDHPVFRLKKADQHPEQILGMSPPGPIHEFSNGSASYIAQENMGKEDRS